MTGRTRDLVLAVAASARADKTLAPLLRESECRLGVTVEDSLKMATAMDFEEPLREIMQRNAARDIANMFEDASVLGAVAKHELPPKRRRTVEAIAHHLWAAAARLRVEYAPET